MRILIIIPFILYGCGVGLSQCQSIMITKQSQIDSFSIEYPNCTEFGNISIIGRRY